MWSWCAYRKCKLMPMDLVQRTRFPLNNPATAAVQSTTANFTTLQLVRQLHFYVSVVSPTTGCEVEGLQLQQQ
jgi:hypothetical protein